MTEYFVKAKDYFKGIGLNDSSSYFSVNLQECQQSMQGIASRYDLKDRTIFSVGAGEGFEEYWLWDAGNILILNDITKSFEDIVKPLEQCDMSGIDRQPSKIIRWIFEDIGQWVADNPEQEFEMLYVSSLHPDEFRRKDIQEKFVETRTDEQARHYITWPREEAPYDDLVVDSFKKVKEGGLILLQHYRNGVYVQENPQYLELIEEQFLQYGVQLLEAHCFRKSTVHLLVTAYKGSREEALAYQKTLADRPPIASFHGRYPEAEIRNDVVKVFELGNPDLVPQFYTWKDRLYIWKDRGQNFVRRLISRR